VHYCLEEDVDKKYKKHINSKTTLAGKMDHIRFKGKYIELEKRTHSWFEKNFDEIFESRNKNFRKKA
jgi:hypothetical protein